MRDWTGVGRAHEAVRTRVAQKLDEIDERIASLRRVREELERVVGCACQLARPLHVRRRLPRPRRARPAARAAAPRDERRERRQHAAADDARRRGALVAGRPARGALFPPRRRPSGRAVRARFLSDCGWGSERSLLELQRRDRLFEQALEADTTVVLWFENDLYDQLQLLQALALAGDSPLELIQADSDLGPLQPEELEELWPQRRPVTLHTRALAREAWDAFRAPEPAGIAALLERDTSALPHLESALRRLLEELPDAKTGPSPTRTAIARAATRRPTAAG